MFKFIHICIHTYVFIYIHTYIHLYLYIHIYIQMYMHVHKSIELIHELPIAATVKTAAEYTAPYMPNGELTLFSCVSNLILYTIYPIH
jgi:hypothetical protein